MFDSAHNNVVAQCFFFRRCPLDMFPLNHWNCSSAMATTTLYVVRFSCSWRAFFVDSTHQMTFKRDFHFTVLKLNPIIFHSLYPVVRCVAFGKHHLLLAICFDPLVYSLAFYLPFHLQSISPRCSWCDNLFLLSFPLVWWNFANETHI